MSNQTGQLGGVANYGNTAFAVPPTGGYPIVEQNVVPIIPYDVVTPTATVGNTGMVAVIDVIVPVDVYITEIDINPSVDVLTNGVVFYIQYYTNIIGSRDQPVTATPSAYSRQFLSPFVAALPKGSHITVFANSVTAGSTLQLAVQGFYFPLG